VLIVGGGPAGSTCAWTLRQAGADVAVIDKATFPRDKVCAGWITPQVIDDLRMDPDEYRAGRTFQPITGFRIGFIGTDHVVDVSYDRAVSFGIRRVEFDHYLLRRSGARVLLGVPVTSIRRSGAKWIVNEQVETPMLVGAGGHGCPVARLLNGSPDRALLVATQEAEFRIPAPRRSDFTASAERAELYFCGDLSGYGWCFRKEDYVNIGFGRVNARALPAASNAFVDFLKSRKTIPADAAWTWRGHGYLLFGQSRRRALEDGAVLVGDSAGLAYPQSGEGIRPAIESGLKAASTIRGARGDYSRERLEPYGQWLLDRFGSHWLTRVLPCGVPPVLADLLRAHVVRNPWLARHVLLDRCFLHGRQSSFAPP
jgi:flavin-dependent dehydrogenase